MSEHLLAEWSRLLVESLADAGLEKIIVSPGSRSTPLVWAALACSRLRCEHVVDERCAAFYAVGQAKVTKKPAALLCTSGSAAANYFPAVVEASLSHTPLLVLTADRPFELMDCGASQTIDQVKLYGDYVRHFVDVGMPDETEGALRALRRVASQAVARTLGEPPGPVHVNVRARKPLEPPLQKSPRGEDLATRVDHVLSSRIATVRRARRDPAPEAIAEVADHCRRARSGIIACGPMNPAERPSADSIARLSRATGFPVFAEATSGLRFDSPGTDIEVDGLGILLGCEHLREGVEADVVLELGAALTSATWEAYVRSHPGSARFVLSSHGWPDPASTAAAIVHGDIGASIAALSEALDVSAFSSDRLAFASRLREMNALVCKAVDDELDGAELTEGAAVRITVEGLVDGSLLCLGNSLPVREVDTFVRARAARVTVWSQRGASGIDGLVSGAAGAARAFGGPAALLVGDVSFLHDLGGMHVARRAEGPFGIVVLNNDGGRIFEQLPVAARTDLPRAAMDFWTTPHGIHFDPVARLFGVEYARVGSRAELAEALSAAQRRNGCSLIEVCLEPNSAREEHHRLAVRLNALRERSATQSGRAP